MSAHLNAIIAHGAACDALSALGDPLRVHPGEAVAFAISCIHADGFDAVPTYHHRNESWVVDKVQALGGKADAGELVDAGELTEVWAGCLALQPSQDLLAMLAVNGAA